MVPTTTEALLILLAFVLPGALLIFAFERQAGPYKITAPDRLLRFIALSVLLDLLYAVPLFLARGSLLADGLAASRFMALWLTVIVCLGLPIAAGTVVGGLYATRDSRHGWQFVRKRLAEAHEKRLLAVAVGRAAPRAWDHGFGGRRGGFVRVRLTDGSYVGGQFGDESYAARFPHDGDLYLDEVWPVRADGAFGEASLGYGLYVPAATISSIDFVALTPKEMAHG